MISLWHFGNLAIVRPAHRACWDYVMRMGASSDKACSHIGTMGCQIRKPHTHLTPQTHDSLGTTARSEQLPRLLGVQYNTQITNHIAALEEQQFHWLSLLHSFAVIMPARVRI